jgi:hypothetical protein
MLDGKARSVSSSHIWTGRLSAKGRIAIDLFAMVPPKDGKPKIMKEYDPPVFPLRWMKYGGLLFLSGVTDMTHPTFDEQFPPSSSASPARSRRRRNVERRQKSVIPLHHEESLATLPGTV